MTGTGWVWVPKTARIAAGKLYGQALSLGSGGMEDGFVHVCSGRCRELRKQRAKGKSISNALGHQGLVSGNAGRQVMSCTTSIKPRAEAAENRLHCTGMGSRRQDTAACVN
ncbi:hypothetical protein HRR83_001272 [Exophiala dermatitidis]|nr:hypothetical protein HRR74_001276 [Exophiala dermatitidis]KAJ4526973.1 hypothetical protein HRR73_001770 [Exophiala dermatitidis]KAJ4532687.1 hypothetical protein HRR76_007671 [Exophiala dermatitidis]KAJ4546800.1 hypothetical protein HRR77_004345 [Exophiala dermatitidis]KAJ4573834.1 hypothetical protein HRR79_002843 [Exophiala dermatitidis]